MRTSVTTLMVATYQLTEENVKSATAYVLLYRKVRIDDAAVSNRARSCTGYDNTSHLVDATCKQLIPPQLSHLSEPARGQPYGHPSFGQV